MKRGKRFCALFLSIILVVLLAFVGCGNGGEEVSSNGGEKTEIVVGYVAPFTGPISAHTVGFDWVAEKALKKINEDGGIYIKAYDKKLPVRIVKGDSESSATKASEVASKLVLNEKVDILCGAWTPDTSLPVSAVAERNKIPCFISNSPADSWLTGGPYEWSYGMMFYVEDLLKGYIGEMDKLDTNKKVGFLFDSEVDGVLFSEMLNEMLPERGYEIVDPGRFAVSTTDYTNIISQLKNGECDIIMGNQVTPNFTTAWQQFQQLGYVPKAMVIGKALQFANDVEALGGDTGVGIMSERHWDRSYNLESTLLDYNAEELADAYEKENNTQYPFTLGYDLSFFEVLYETFLACEDLEPETIRESLAAVDYVGIFGPMKFDDNNVMRAATYGAQWVKGEKWPIESKVISLGSFPGISIEQEPIVIPNSTR